MPNIPPRKNEIGVNQLIRKHWLSVTIISVIALVQVGIFYLVPPVTQTALARNFENPSWWSWFTYAFVHESPTHLISNLVVYLAGAYASWLILIRANRQKLYLEAVALMVLGAPPIVGGLSHVVFSHAGRTFGYSKGFSGVALAFVLFSYAMVLSAVYRRHSKALAETLTFGVTAGAFILAGILTNMNSYALLFGFCSVIPIGGLVVSKLYGRTVSFREIFAWVREGSNSPILLVVTAGLFGVSLVTLQPASSGGTATNIIGHYLGLLYGGLLGVAIHNKR